MFRLPAVAARPRWPWRSLGAGQLQLLRLRVRPPLCEIFLRRASAAFARIPQGLQRGAALLELLLAFLDFEGGGRPAGQVRPPLKDDLLLAGERVAFGLQAPRPSGATCCSSLRMSLSRCPQVLRCSRFSARWSRQASSAGFSWKTHRFLIIPVQAGQLRGGSLQVQVLLRAPAR